ncbi:MAG: xanthine dehydrogenase family protein molybdopterin-binding subunit [Pseudomonadota bacterium]|nr:xanthine dehydrogenase family protein molybdopterin-binding subunit [Pseudomonadota bacterium]
MGTNFIGDVLGQRIVRTEDQSLLTGRSKFVDDISLKNSVDSYFLRSPHPHARIISIDTAAARKAKGVFGVFKLDDFREYLTATRVPLGMPDPDQPPNSSPCILADEEVCHVGEPVVMVVAENRYEAEDAASLIQIEYELLPSVSDCRKALEPEAPFVHSNNKSNLSLERVVSFGDCDAAFLGASHIFREKLWQHKGSAQSIETRGVLASYDPIEGLLTLWTSTQVPHRVHAMISGMLNLQEKEVRVIAPAVGGGFGPKFVLYPEDVCIGLATKILDRPVKWIEDRREHFSATVHERDQFWDLEVAVDKKGFLLGVRGQLIHDQGAYSLVGTSLPYNAATNVPGPYRLKNYTLNIKLALTNKICASSVRGAGYPQGNFAMERLLDRVARELKIGREEIRRRNLISAKEMPYTSPLKSRDGEAITYDSGDFLADLNRAMEIAKFSEFSIRQKRALRNSRYIGFGLANYVKGTGRGPFESAVIRIGPSGGITVSTGAAEQGQGIKMSLAQICADALGVSPRDIDVVAGDTGSVPIGLGTFASRQAVTAGSSVHIAANEIRQKALTVGAHLLEAAETDLELVDGVVRVKGVPELFVSLGEIAHAVGGTPGFALPGGIKPGLDASSNFMPKGLAYCSGAQAAEVEVDIETGDVTILNYVAVQDSGRLINPLIVDGQVAGGITHGIGNALFERLYHDEIGQPLTTTLAEYLLPTAPHIPSLNINYSETLCNKNPIGVKGIGEGGTVPVPAVIISAVENALAPFGVVIEQTPIDPSKIVDLVQQSIQIS